MNQHEIAKLANVSTATVSRIINGVSTVDPVLARRVWRVIKRVGYYPNNQARALVSGRSRIFGLMVSEITNPFFPEIVQRFTQLGVEHNQQVLLSSIPCDPGLLDMSARQVVGRRVDGVAILSFRREESLIEFFRCQNVPVFAVDADLPGPLLKTVCIDYQHGMRQAVQHLAALGHVRIAFVSGPPALKAATARRVAFQQCMKEIDLETPLELLVEGDHTMEAGIKAMSALTSLPDPPAAVVCSDDMTAIGVMRQASELGLNIPQDLSVVGFEDSRLTQFIIPPLTSVRISPIEIADFAFRALLDPVESSSERSSPEVNTVKTNLVLRRSTAFPPGRLREVVAGKRQHEHSGLARE